MDGAIVINGYLDGESFREPAEMISESARDLGIGMTTLMNTDLAFPVGDSEALRKRLGDVDFVIFWDKDVMLAKNIELCDIPVFNCSECIRICDDKSLTHTVLEEWGIPSIRTVVSPMSFGRPIGDWVRSVKEYIGYPMVVKDCFGSFGQQVRMVSGDEDLLKEAELATPRIFQEYIDCSGEDLRLEVVGGSVVAAVKRRAKEGDFRSNASNGGMMSPYTPTEQEAMLAVEAANAVQADFAGVDILQTEKGPVVCEVNSNAHIKNLLNATGIDVSRHILGYISDFLR